MFYESELVLLFAALMVLTVLIGWRGILALKGERAVFPEKAEAFKRNGQRQGYGKGAAGYSQPDFLRYNGAYYLYEEKECRKLDVSEFLGTVRFIQKEIGNRRTEAPGRQAGEAFEASRLPEGTELYRIRGVLDDSQLAAKGEDVYKVYEMVSEEVFMGACEER